MNAVGVQISESLCDLSAVIKNLSECETVPNRVVRLNLIPERASGHVFHCEEKPASVFAGFVKGCDSRMRAGGKNRCTFTIDVLWRIEKLYGHPTSNFEIPSVVND